MTRWVRTGPPGRRQVSTENLELLVFAYEIVLTYVLTRKRGEEVGEAIDYEFEETSTRILHLVPDGLRRVRSAFRLATIPPRSSCWAAS
jgi:hypothetical protein